MPNAAPITLLELVPPALSAGRRVQLVDHSMAEVGVMESRQLHVEKKVYPGGNQVELQQLGLEDEDLTLTGLLRDQWGSPGFVQAARTALYALQAAQNPVWLSWGDTWGRLVLLTHVQFEHQRGGLRYTLQLAHLELASDVAKAPKVSDPTEPLRAIDDVEAELVTVSNVIQPEGFFGEAAALAQTVLAFAADARATVGQLADAISVQVVGSDLVANIRSGLTRAMTTASQIRNSLVSTDYGALIIPSSGAAVLAAWTWQSELLASLLRLDQRLRVAGKLLEQVTVTHRTRRVLARQGDTLQAIAARELGDFRRWAEIATLNNLLPGALLSGYLQVPAQ